MSEASTMMGMQLHGGCSLGTLGQYNEYDFQVRE